jgi:hypothetical protein
VAVCTTLSVSCSSGSVGKADVVPLYERVLLGDASAREAAQVQVAIETRRLDFVVGCMSERGFTFFAPPPASVVQLYDGPERSSIEYARTFGFGVSTNPPPAAPAGEASDDRNVQYLEGLSPQGQAAYGTAAADCEARSADLATTSPELAAVQARFDRLTGQLRASEGYSRLVETWRECVSAKGFQADDLDSMIDSFARRSAEVRASGDASMVESLRQEEISAAVSTFECNDEFTAGYHAAYEQLAASG